VAEKSAIQRIKDLDAERAGIFDQAKEEALEKARAAVAELNALGLNYTLTSGGKAAKAGSGKGKGAIKAAVCPICEFQTTVRRTALPYPRTGRSPPINTRYDGAHAFVIQSQASHANHSYVEGRYIYKKDGHVEGVQLFGAQ
jgi:hypothetical protein